MAVYFGLHAVVAARNVNAGVVTTIVLRFLCGSAGAEIPVSDLYEGKLSMQAMFMALLLLVLPGCSPAQLQKGIHLDRIEMPPGFKISLYARVPGARSMSLSPGGVLFVGTRDKGSVYAVLDREKDHVADEVLTIASGLHMPNGVAFRKGALFVAEVSRVLRFDNIESNLGNPPEPVVVNSSFPTDEHHG
jgi:glucose/arabinose dehydrogenase